MEGLGVDWSTERPRRPWQIAQHKRPLLVLLKEGMRAEVGEGREVARTRCEAEQLWSIREPVKRSRWLEQLRDFQTQGCFVLLEVLCSVDSSLVSLPISNTV